MSAFAFITSLFHKAEAELPKIEAAAKTADKFIGVVLGEAEEVSGVIAAVDPSIGGPILAAVTTLETGHKALIAAMPTIASNITTVGEQVATLMGQAADLAVQLAPFFKVTANDVETALAAIKAQAATPATAS